MIARARSPFGLLMFGLIVLMMVAVLSTVGDTAAEIGQGWVPGVDELEPDANEPIDLGDPFENVNTPPMLRAILAVLLMVVLLVLGLLVVLGLIITVIGFNTARTRRAALAESAYAQTADDEFGEADIALVTVAARQARDLLMGVDSGGEPGDTVVRAWLVLERATADAGLGRRPHQTPTEFTTEVLAGLRVDAAALDRLRVVYQRARFSSRPVTAADVDTARAALDRLVDDLSQRADA